MRFVLALLLFSVACEPPEERRNTEWSDFIAPPAYADRPRAYGQRPGGPTNQVSRAPIPELPDEVGGEYNQIQQVGQSLSTGLAGGVALTVTSLNTTVLNRGVSVPLCRSVEGTTSNPPNACGVTGNDLETGMVAMGDTIVSMGSTRRWVLGNTGCNGAPASEIRKGGSSPACYDNSWELTGHVATTHTAVSPSVHRAAAGVLIHGEGDEGVTSRAVYRDFLIDYQQDIRGDTAESTGQSFRTPLFLTQQHCWTACNSTATSEIVLAQLDASENDPNSVVLCGPRYQYTYADGTHLTSTYYRQQGEEFGRCIYIVEELGVNPYPMVPRVTLTDADTITLDFSGRIPCVAAGDCSGGPLVFDTTLVAAVADNGFEYLCSEVGAGTISNTTIVGSTVVIDLSAPHIIGCEVAYAYTGIPDAESGSLTGARGNLRDSTSFVGPRSGLARHSWVPTFRKLVPGGQEPGTLFSNRALLLNGTNETIACSDITVLDGAEATICGWMRTSNWGVTYRSFVSKYNFGTQNSFEIARITGAELRDYAANPANGTQVLVSTNDFGVNNAWIFHCMTLGSGAANADRAVQYRNGAANLAVTYTGTFGTTMVDSTSLLRIGSYNGAVSFWEGYIDDISIFNERVSPACIASYYGTGIPIDLMTVPSCPQPDHYFTFEALDAADTGTLGTAACNTLTNIDATNFVTPP